MKFVGRGLGFIVFSLGLLTVNFAASLPARAEITCEPETVNNYENNQLESCLLKNKIKVQVYHSQTGTYTFVCEQKNYIFFAENGKFKSCVLSTPVQIKLGNSVENCPEKSMVQVESTDNSSIFMSCRRLSY